MGERTITPVQSNYEKQQTYVKLLRKHRQAMSQGFYCEAIMIDYAVIEDRLRSMIYHMGFISNRQAKAIWKKARPYLSYIVNEYKYEKENEKLGLTNLGDKIKIVRCIMRWVSETDDDYKSNPHLCVLKTRLEGIDIDGCLQVLEDIGEWSGYRNEIVHAMMNKNIISLEESLYPNAEKGMKLGRELDSYEKELKKGNLIRRKVNLPMT